MKAVKFSLYVAAVLASVSAVAAQNICKNYGKKCPEETPCCNQGWCSNDPKYCSTGCDKTGSFSAKSCFPDPPCVSLHDDFDEESLVNWKDYNGDPNSARWTSDFTPDYASYNSGNMVLSLKSDGVNKNDFGKYQGFGSTVSSTRFMEFGTVTARIKTGSSAKGIVSSFITKNEVGDEIDYEWVGKDPSEVQTNFYWNAVLDYTHGGHHDVGADTTQDFHIYTIEWMPDHITWIIDGNAVRTVQREETLKDGQYQFPARPSRVQLSMWDGGMGAEGTAQWAGSPTDWSDQNKVYSMEVDWVNITCLYNGNKTTDEWPPEGYGPPTKTKTGDDSYETLGEGVPPNSGPGGHGEQIESVGGHDYSASQAPKFVVPVAVVCGAVVMIAAGVGVWRYRRAREQSSFTRFS